MPAHRIHCIHLLYRAGRCAEAIVDALLEGVTARQFAALVTIAGHEGIDQVAVTARTGIDQSTASGIIRRLTRKRLVQRRRSKADARAYALRLTDEGRRVLRTGSR